VAVWGIANEGTGRGGLTSTHHRTLLSTAEVTNLRVIEAIFDRDESKYEDMASKRRGFLTLCAGLLVLIAKGSDEAARLLARGGDELLASGAKSSDEASSSTSSIDELVEAGKRHYRRERLESLLSDETRTESFTLPPGWYAGYHLEPTTHTDLEIQFQTYFGETIDAFVLGKESFEQYERDGQFDGLGVWTVYQEASTTATVELDSNTEYVIVFDHTGAGLAEPGDADVTVDTEVSLGITQ